MSHSKGTKIVLIKLGEGEWERWVVRCLPFLKILWPSIIPKTITFVLSFKSESVGTGRAREELKVPLTFSPGALDHPFRKELPNPILSMPPPHHRQTLSCHHGHDAEASTNSFTCFARQYLHFTRAGRRTQRNSTGMLGSVPKGCIGVMVQAGHGVAGRRKVSGRMCLASLESPFTKPHHFLESRFWGRDWDFTSPGPHPGYRGVLLHSQLHFGLMSSFR